MYSVSQDYLDALDLPVRTYKLAGTVGGVSFDESNILSIEISNQVSEGSEIKLGSVYIGELTASFYGVTGIARGSWVGKTIVLSEGLMLEDNSFEYVPLGVFTIAEANHTQEGVDVVAYDAMTAFDKARNDLTETGTAYDFLSLMCQKCGVTLGMTSADVAALTNGTETLSIYSENDIETWRDLLSWVAQTLCSVATINRAGELELRQYSVSSAATIDETHRFTGCSFSDFTTYYTGMSVVNIALRQTEYKSVTPDDGLTYNLGSNPLVQGDYELVQNIIDEFSDVQLVPFSAQMLGGAIYDLCDCLTFSGGIAAGAVCGVMGYTWKYNGAYAVNGFGSNPALATAKSKAQKDIDAIYNTIGEEINQMSVVQNSSSVTCGESTEASILTYNFEVTQEENTTMVDVSVVMTSSASETEANDVYTLSDIVAHLSFYVDGSEVSVYSPEFIVDEGKDTMTFNYSLSGLSVGAHQFDVRLTVDGGSGSIAVGDVHEMLWGYGITFEVYVKSLMVAKLPDRTVFYAGQKLDYTGIQVDAVYNNGLRSDVTAQCAYDPVEETLLTQDDVGTITVAVEATVDDVDLDTSFDVIVKDGSWKGCAIYPGFRPYDNMWDWVKISDFTKGSISVAYPGTAGLNDEDVVSYSRGWGSDSQSSRASFTGKGVYGNGNFSLAPNGKVEQYYFAPCLGGSMYWWEDGNDMVFARVDADSKNGEIGNEIISRVSKANYKANTLYNSGVTVPLYASTGAGVYGKVYILNTSDGTITPMHTFSTSTKNESVVLDDGSEYHFFHPYEGSSGSDPDKYLVEFKDGVLHGHSLSIAGYYEYAALHYDASDEVLVLYLGNKTYSNSNYTYTTKCYKIDPSDYSVTEVTLPTSLIITQMDTSEDSSHVGYDTAEAVVLLNGTTTGQSEHSRYVYNGRICVGNPVTQYNYGYFDAYNGKRTPQQFLMLDGWGSYSYYSANYHRICYVDNLYFEESENNRIFLNVYHGL